MGLDGEKSPIDSLTSNIGHCLWAGIVDDDKAKRTVEHLCGPEMFTGWGIRTLRELDGAATTPLATTTALCGLMTAPSVLQGSPGMASSKRPRP